MDELDRDPAGILPYPLQNVLTRPLRTAAGEQGRAEYMSLWAGQGVRLSRELRAADLVRQLALELEHALRDAGRIGGRTTGP